MSQDPVPPKPAVLITGSSSGIGEACVLDLAGRGFRVFAGVRNEKDGRRLCETANDIEPILLDVTDPDSVSAAAGRLNEAVGVSGLTGLVNNAGIVVPGPLELLPTGDFRRQLEVNVLGTHAVTRAMLPLLRRATGRIVLLSSISGRVTPPLYGAYAASKHALEAMGDAWRMELRPWKVAVSLVEPDTVTTPIWDKFDRTVAQLALQAEPDAQALYAAQIRKVRKASAVMSRRGLPVSKVVQAVRHALRSPRPKARYPIGARTRLAFWAAAHLPAWMMDWSMERALGLK